jgi:hypothetical protein
MTLQHFRTLSQDKQFRKLLLNGVFLTSRDTDENCILLFQLGNFYVEIFFNRECEEIIYSRSFKNTDKLEPYLEQIDISGIV